MLSLQYSLHNAKKKCKERKINMAKCKSEKKLVPCSVCGTLVEQEYYPQSTSPMWAKKSGKPYEIMVCGSKICRRAAYEAVIGSLREKTGCCDGRE